MKKQIFISAMVAMVLALGPTPAQAWSHNLEEFVITTYDISPESISINGNFVAWRGRDWMGYYLLFGYDLPTKQEFVICPTDVDPTSVSNNGNFVVWKNTSTNLDFRGYDLSTKQEFVICPNDVDPTSINLSDGNDFVVWKNWTDLKFYGYDLSIKQGFVICPNNVDSGSISIGGNYVAWKDNTDLKLYGCDLPTEEKFVICPNDVESTTSATCFMGTTFWSEKSSPFVRMTYTTTQYVFRETATMSCGGMVWMRSSTAITC